jgi:hypothetical protein
LNAGWPDPHCDNRLKGSLILVSQLAKDTLIEDPGVVETASTGEQEIGETRWTESGFFYVGSDAIVCPIAID